MANMEYKLVSYKRAFSIYFSLLQIFSEREAAQSRSLSPEPSLLIRLAAGQTDLGNIRNVAGVGELISLHKKAVRPDRQWRVMGRLLAFVKKVLFSQ